ncbi:SIMPL domain-containing protein [Dolichospermum sp. UHCC 0259]|uniref:SIMPL domain-containing protein n=1 Tax=Dolichospermum sp. UHCC 0259 TaxID=2590010 RepID=UPI001446886D|nr:SIMPL domain-containing protein [Dolichospermum sp. UHCC 0259]MTJ46717.1 SIMPL domain-containing protein [Dolichospermum sp. UHCC 0259]
MSITVLSNYRFPTRNFGKVLSLSIFFSAIFMLPASAQEKLWRTLTVTGKGVETISTTLSQVSLGVEVQGKTAEDAQKEAARRSSAVVALLEKRNVEKLTTTGIRLNPVYSYNGNVQRVTGYAVSNTVNFRIPTDKAETLLDDVVKAGATQINGVSFIASDEAIAIAQKQALKKATQDAQEQAETVLSALKLEPKDIISIQINGATPPSPPLLYRIEAAKASLADASTPIIAGEQEVQASVTLQISY